MKLSQWILLTLASYIAFMSTGKFALGTPLELKNEDFGAITLYTSCKFDGIAKKCHIDTGMRLTEANGKFFASYTVVRKSESKNVSGKASDCREIIVSSVALGEKEKKSVLANNCEGNRLHDAVIGVDFFAGERFQLSIKNKTLDFDAPPIAGGSTLLNLRDNYFALPVTIGDANFLGLFDTGAGLTVVDEALVSRLPKLFSIHAETIAHTPNGDIKTKIYKLKSVKVGDLTLKDVLCLAIPFKAMHDSFGQDMQMIIGNNIIGKFDWQIDLRNRRYKVSQ